MTELLFPRRPLNRCDVARSLVLCGRAELDRDDTAPHGGLLAPSNKLMRT